MLKRLALALAVVAPCAVNAQTVRGVVTDGRTTSPLSGVVVLLLDHQGREVSRALTADDGEYRLTARGPGVYVVRTLRIGFRPVTSDSVRLAADGESVRQVALFGIPFALDTVRVGGRTSCDVRQDAARATFAVWEQARTALSAAQITSTSRAIQARAVIYERTLEPNREQVVQQSATVLQRMTSRPWNALPADSFHRVGYVQTGIDGDITFYAPDLAMLLSEEFIQDHCLKLVNDDRDASRIGIEFEPTRDRRRIPEISGTMWLDRKSNELREMQFRYVNVPREQTFGRPSTPTIAALE